MSSEPPPSRYRVVERGRRLEVIDTLAGDVPVTPPSAPRGRLARVDTQLARLFDPAAAASTPKAAIVERAGFDGRAVLTTRPWFDDKAPRRLWLDPGAAQRLDGARSLAIGAAVVAAILTAFQPFLAILLVPLLDRRIRARLRGAVTTWLDRLDPAD